MSPRCPTASINRLSSGLPGTIAAPESPPRRAASPEISRSPPLASPSPWHSEQCITISGRMRFSKNSSCSGDGSSANAALAPKSHAASSMERPTRIPSILEHRRENERGRMNQHICGGSFDYKFPGREGQYGGEISAAKRDALLRQQARETLQIPRLHHSLLPHLVTRPSGPAKGLSPTLAVSNLSLSVRVLSLLASPPTAERKPAGSMQASLSKQQQCP